jgi:hypothetical protein
VQAQVLLYIALVDAVLDLEDLVLGPRGEFVAGMPPRRLALIRAFSAVRPQALSIVPALTLMILSMGDIDRFFLEWSENRTRLYDAIIACPAFRACRWRLLPENGPFEFVEALAALGNLVAQGGDNNSFDVSSQQCRDMLTASFEQMELDGYDVQDLVGPYERCLACLRSDVAFIADAGASHAALRATMRNNVNFGNFDNF